MSTPVLPKFASVIAGVTITSALVLAPPASAAEINVDTVNQFLAAVQYEAEKYGTGYVSVSTGYFEDDDTIAMTSGYDDHITLNALWAALPPERFNALMIDDVATGYQPGGCTGIAAVAIHEMGHVIDRRTGMNTRLAVAEAGYAQIAPYVHSYGQDSPGEAVAVSFQAAECGSATPTEMSIYNVLMDSYYTE